MEYSEKVMEHFTHPHNVGKLDDADGIGEVGNAKCGDIMKMYIKVQDGIITDVKFNTYGCASAIATSFTEPFAASIIFFTAPMPLPEQPIRPTLSCALLPSAHAKRGRVAAAPITAVDLIASLLFIIFLVYNNS